MLPSKSLAYVFYLTLSPAFAAYNLVEVYAGDNFFNGWDYADKPDTNTNGAVNWVTAVQGIRQNLTFVNANGNPIIKVDNTTYLPPSPGSLDGQLRRSSVSLSTRTFYPIGSVIVFDAVHIPAGCSVRPAFWTRGFDWPHDGQIDIVEGANRMNTNRMTLHANPGCMHEERAEQRGQTVGADCAAGRNSSEGCTVQDTLDGSFGERFNSAGGGVWAAQLDETGVNIWFWTREDVPEDVSNATDTLRPSQGWGSPAAAWPATSCDINTYFKAQQLVLDINLCGDRAGEPSVYNSSGCTTPSPNVNANTCYLENVDGDGSNYAEAYFEINYIKVFTTNNTILVPSVSGSSIVLSTATSLAQPGGAASGRVNGATLALTALAALIGAGVGLTLV